MLSPWSNTPEDFVLEDYLERYGDAIEACPGRYAGTWVWAFRPAGSIDAAAPFREVRLDLGCGKGAFAVASALREPDVLFVGLDADPVCIALAARLAIDSGARNTVFVPARDSVLSAAFAPSELSAIYLNFPTPHPKGREAQLRLTCASRLEEYRHLLREDGMLGIRTDNQPFYSYTLAQLEIAGFEVPMATEDARSELPGLPETAYERRAVEQGARICAIAAVPRQMHDSIAGAQADTTFGSKPRPIPRTASGQELAAASDSLYDYLPSDLDSLLYVPPEMSRGIAAIRRTRTQSRRKHQGRS